MKVLYSKFNSERDKRFQLKTIVYEKDHIKYVKKEALTTESIEHLKSMKANYKKLSESIINPKLKLTPIVAESANSLTFEFIEGESLEHKFSQSLKRSKQEAYKVIETYIEILNTGFKTTQFDHTKIDTKEMTRLFGNNTYASEDGELCFDNISNIDLIFSNIIYKESDIYIIDYEWTYNVSLPIKYILQRTLGMLSELSEEDKLQFMKHTPLYDKMERYFIDKYVMHNGFYFQRHVYMKTNAPIAQHIEAKEAHIEELKGHAKGLQLYIDDLNHELHRTHQKLQNTGNDLTYAREIINYRDGQLEDARIKNRIKKIVQKIIPVFILEGLGYSVDEDKVKKEPTPIAYLDENKKQFIYTYNQPGLNNIIQSDINSFLKTPLISIIMPVYNVDPLWLDKAIQSVESQWYENWELCIADDKSTNEETLNYLKNIDNPKIKITFLEKNLNISGASNAALSLAIGEYIALLDNDDELTPDALYEMVKVINQKDADFIYSDEDFISTEGQCSNPHYKPDFSPDLLLSHNYITHFSCFKKELLDTVGYFNSQFDGSQDYDLFLRLTEQTDNIQHIQKVLYHWRTIEGSTSADSEAKPEAIARSKHVLEEAMKRRGIDATIENGNLNHFFHVRYAIKDNPLISIIIPFKDKPELLDMSINSILEKSTYPNYEIIGISNNSEEQATFDMMATLEKKDSRVSFFEYNTEFNYADINNHSVNTYAKGEHILLLNNDIEVIEPTWLEAMLELSQRDEIGCVGAKLYYPNDTIQHAGIIIGLGGYAGHSHKMYPRDNPGYFNRLNAIQNLSAVTAACLMIKKRIYQEIGGMDDVKFKVAYNDVDFCLRVREKGYFNLFTPYAEAYHHESISRGYETTPEKIARFQTEKDALLERHKDILTDGDPYYNPNLCHDKEDFSLCPKENNRNF